MTAVTPTTPIDPGGEWHSPLYEAAVEQLETVADLLDLDAESRTRLREPRRALTVNFPVRMDDGEVASFTGYRVQHTLIGFGGAGSHQLQWPRYRIRAGTRISLPLPASPRPDRRVPARALSHPPRHRPRDPTAPTSIPPL